MNNLWILTEERPKNSVILAILQEYCKLKNKELKVSEIKILPKALIENFCLSISSKVRT